MHVYNITYWRANVRRSHLQRIKKINEVALGVGKMKRGFQREGKKNTLENIIYNIGDTTEVSTCG
jgi:hypothetical protein